jgi:hypothetical protein
LEIAELIRSGEDEIPSHFSEYQKVISIVCSYVVPTSTGMNIGFLYESAKDVLRYNNLKIMDHIKEVMQIGSLVYLDDENFDKIKNKNNSGNMSGDDLNALALAMGA